MSRDQNLKIGISRERKKILSWNFGKIFVITRQLIWAVKIISSCYGSRVIPILNIDHVTTRSRDFFKFFKPFLGMCSMGLHKACTINWPYILWFSHNKAPQFDLRVCMYISRTKRKRRTTDPHTEVTGAGLLVLCIFWLIMCILDG